MAPGEGGGENMMMENRNYMVQEDRKSSFYGGVMKSHPFMLADEGKPSFYFSR